jgi:hypothetical protein
VVSRTIQDEGTEALVIRGDVVPTVAELKEGTGRDIVLHGGSGLVVELAEADLIDEYMLFVSPAAIGAGKPLFSGLQRELLVGEGEHFAALTDGSAVIAGRRREWSTIGVYRLRGARLAECWLVPFAQAEFDSIWSGASGQGDQGRGTAFEGAKVEGR